MYIWALTKPIEISRQRVKPKHPATRRCVQSGLFDGIGSFLELEKRIHALPVEDTGDAFEVFIEAYLATQKINQAKGIWPEKVIPPHLTAKFNLGQRKGVGVDGIYEGTDGTWCAYQVKFRSAPNLTYKEVSSFFGITEAFEQRVVITNCNRVASQINDRPNSFCIRGHDLACLEAGDFDEIHGWLSEAVVEHTRKVAYPHQQEAIDAILPVLNEHIRVSTIMACGTGKTLVTLWVAEQCGAKTILVLVPSLALIRQTLHEWLREADWSDLAYLCVCSDSAVQRGADEIVVRPSELDFRVGTDSSTVSNFLTRGFSGTKIVFSTYQSANVVADGMASNFKFDLAIFDEAHKTAGRQGKKNSLALDDTNLPVKSRLFVTATPRHYSPRQRTNEGEQALVYSMDNPEVYGPLDRRYELSFAEAARRQIICDYKIIISAITLEEVTNELIKRGEVLIEGDSVRAMQVANQLAIKAAIEHYGVAKIFTFHGTVKSARSFTSDGPEGINSIIPGLPAFHVNGTMNAADREQIMGEFSSEQSGVVSNARCLTEGVDVPAVDMVAFMSPKKSKVDIVQATGRAMRRPRGESAKKIGYVFIPLYVEQARDESLEEAVKRLDFDDLADVLNAMREQDEVLADTIRAMREDRGRLGGYDDSQFRERVEVLRTSVQLDTLQDAITTACVDRLGATWDERYGELKAFKEEHGHCTVPTMHTEDPGFGLWIKSQRRAMKKGELRADRIAKLELIGFDFDPYESAWESKFEDLKIFKEEFGHCNVPKNYAANRELGVWCKGQRDKKARGALSKERIARLEQIGFDFDPIDSQWEEMFEELKSFKSEKGHCDVLTRYKGHNNLGSWCHWQRTQYKSGKLDDDKVRRLLDLGFDFSPKDTFWESMFDALESFKKEHGHCNVPMRYEPNPSLGTWVRRMRQDAKKGLLEQERVNRLKALGFDFDPINTKWESMFEKLLEFKSKHGHCDVPLNFEEDSKLRPWCQRQRTAKTTGKLSQDRVTRLEEIGFKWRLQKKR